jgi:hypothetical protein
VEWVPGEPLEHQAAAEKVGLDASSSTTGAGVVRRRDAIGLSWSVRRIASTDAGVLARLECC